MPSSRTNLRTFLRTWFVLIRREPSASSGFRSQKHLYGMQGVRSSSLLGSILRSPVFDWVFLYLFLFSPRYARRLSAIFNAISLCAAFDVRRSQMSLSAMGFWCPILDPPSPGLKGLLLSKSTRE